MDEHTFHPNAGKTAEALTKDRLHLLVDTGLLLSSERSLDVIVQAALDAGLALCGAATGAFFYNNLGPDAESYQLYKVAGIAPEAFAAFAMPRPTPIFAPTFRGESIVRSDDITQDPRYGNTPLFGGMPEGYVPVRSYLAVPVRSRGGEVLGALLYGHPEPGRFEAAVESLVATVAAQAAVAIENFRLTESLTREVALADAARVELLEAERRLRQALDAAQLGTWTWDARTDLIEFDERGAVLFGIQPGVAVPWQNLRQRTVHADDRGPGTQDLRRALENNGLYAEEYRITAAAGDQRWIAASGRAALQSPNTMIGTVQDITLRKVQEESLRQSEKLAATGRMAATIAHEINNPLEAVTNLIYLAKTDPATPATVQRMLETADTELARVAQIAQQTLGFYRDTSRPVEIDLNELLQAVVDLFARKLAGKKLQCTLDMEPALTLVGLQGEIRQVVSNLLVNAIDASTRTGGSIRIRARRRHRDGNHGISVLVSDQGSGIPHEVRPRLFTPFVTTKQSLGTGLGLWVTRGMVEKHGGSVRFRSRTQTPSGTVFRVFLPQTGAATFFGSQTTAVLQ